MSGAFRRADVVTLTAEQFASRLQNRHRPIDRSLGRRHQNHFLFDRLALSHFAGFQITDFRFGDIAGQPAGGFLADDLIQRFASNRRHPDVLNKKLLSAQAQQRFPSAEVLTFTGSSDGFGQAGVTLGRRKPFGIGQFPTGGGQQTRTVAVELH